MERSIYSAFVNIYPNKHEDNEIEENNNEMEYLFYFNETEYLFSFCQYLTYRITTKHEDNGIEENNNGMEYLRRKDQISNTNPFWRKDQISIFTQLDQYYSKRPLTSSLPSKRV